ncbi:MAG: hypothetical protein KGY51_05165, partial [Psychroflexus sp.]|nr:hypothetical protein [Psychroflexus sp.]
LKQNVRGQKFKPDTDQDSYKLVYYFEDRDRQKSFETELETAFETLDYDFKITDEVYTKRKSFKVIHGLSSLLGAQGLAEILIKEGELSKDFNYFAISNENYSIVQIHKNLDQYLKHLNQ